MSYAAKVHHDGSDQLSVDTGGVIAVADNTGLTIGGVAVTAGEAPATYLAAVTPGTLSASKAVVVGATGKIDTLDITSPKINGTAVTATAAELNKLHSTGAVIPNAAAAHAAIADATDAPTVITQLNLALAALRTFGIVAP